MPAIATFKEYMESALYDPKTGYYPNRTVKKDFYTAPELHPAFGGILTKEIVKRLQALESRGVPHPYFVVEMGSGSGNLARQVLQTLRKSHPDWAQKVRFILVERSLNQLLDSVAGLSALSDRLLGYSRVEDILPCSGVFFSNELVDAFPVHLLENSGGHMREVYVDSAGKPRLGQLSTPALRPYAQAAASLPENERHAVNLEALRWLGCVSRKIKSGFLITIDYGSRLPAGACNRPRTFLDHREGPREDLTVPGRDITANVDFEALIAEGRKQGLALESYATLGRFLIDGGIEDWIAGQGDELADFKNRSKIKTLLHPEGMGETYKVLIQSKWAAAL